MAERKTYSADECAEIIGISTDEFYRTRGTLEIAGMPASCTPGRIRISRELFDAWLKEKRRKPLKAANDLVQPENAIRSDDEHRAYLRSHYARG